MQQNPTKELETAIERLIDGDDNRTFKDADVYDFMKQFMGIKIPNQRKTTLDAELIFLDKQKRETDDLSDIRTLLARSLGGVVGADRQLYFSDGTPQEKMEQVITPMIQKIYNAKANDVTGGPKNATIEAVHTIQSFMQTATTINIQAAQTLSQYFKSNRQEVKEPQRIEAQTILGGPDSPTVKAIEKAPIFTEQITKQKLVEINSPTATAEGIPTAVAQFSDASTPSLEAEMNRFLLSANSKSKHLDAQHPVVIKLTDTLYLIRNTGENPGNTQTNLENLESSPDAMTLYRYCQYASTGWQKGMLSGRQSALTTTMREAMKINPNLLKKPAAFFTALSNNEDLRDAIKTAISKDCNQLAKGSRWTSQTKNTWTGKLQNEIYKQQYNATYLGGKTYAQTGERRYNMPWKKLSRKSATASNNSEYEIDDNGKLTIKPHKLLMGKLGILKGRHASAQIFATRMFHGIQAAGLLGTELDITLDTTNHNTARRQIKALIGQATKRGIPLSTLTIKTPFLTETSRMRKFFACLMGSAPKIVASKTLEQILIDIKNGENTYGSDFLTRGGGFTGFFGGGKTVFNLEESGGNFNKNWAEEMLYQNAADAPNNKAFYLAGGSYITDPGRRQALRDRITTEDPIDDFQRELLKQRQSGKEDIVALVSTLLVEEKDEKGQFFNGQFKKSELEKQLKDLSKSNPKLVTKIRKYLSEPVAYGKTDTQRKYADAVDKACQAYASADDKEAAADKIFKAYNRYQAIRGRVGSSQQIDIRAYTAAEKKNICNKISFTSFSTRKTQLEKALKESLASVQQTGQTKKSAEPLKFDPDDRFKPGPK